MKQPIYLDHHATTPVDPRVLEAMLPVFKTDFGNAQSPHHAFGEKAKTLVEKARGHLASLIGCEPEEIIFTSGATESNNLAIEGVCEAYRERGNHVITCVTEHSSVLETCERLERQGVDVTFLPVEEDGRISLETLKKDVTSKTILITIMMANNEIGVLQPIREIAQFAKERGILFHTDATQAVGQMPVNVTEDGIHLLSFSAHKMYGPKGVGALYVRSKNPRVRIVPLMDGGGHEKGLRPGTLNVPGIVGFGEACAICKKEMKEEARRLKALRDRLKEQILNNLEGVTVNGSWEHRLSNNLNMSFSYVEGESLLKSFDTIAVSSSSACTSVHLKVSYVLKALGLPEELIHSSLRFGLGRFNTEEEIDYVAEKVVENVKRLRSMSTLYEIAQEGAKDYILARLPGEKLSVEGGK